ncbi:MAG: hypothetical protein MUP47_03575 [Phycisphaerae bacterium]|nr:hypothetical protein [Phycisphaerae bacterium]
MGYFLVLTWGLGSWHARTGAANRGADMNYTFPYGRHTPQRMAEAARKYGTFCVLDKDGAPAPAESGWCEVGYFALMQLLGMAGVEVDCVLMARIQIGVFLVLSLLFALALGLVARRVWWISFLLLTLLVVFRHHNESLIYYMIGQWMIITAVPLLTLTFMCVLIGWSPSRTWMLGGMLASFSLVGGLVGFVRENEATAMIASLAVFLPIVLKWRRQLTLRRAAVGVVAMLVPYLVTGPILRGAIVLHRAAKTTLRAREYHGGMHHGPWHVLTMCLGRYENPYGYYYSDYFSMELGGQLLRDRGLAPEQEPVGGREYHRVLRDYYVRQIYQHPGYYGWYLLRGAADYAMFLPYAFFLDRPHLRPIGAHLPVARSDVPYDEWDFVWFGPRRADSTVQMDRTALKNLKPRYFYLNAAQWVVFVVMTGVILSGFLLYRKFPGPMRLVLLGLAIVFLFQSIMRILIPMHGWGAVLTYYTAFCVIAVGWVELLVARNLSRPLWARLNRLGVIAALVLLVVVTVVRMVRSSDHNDPARKPAPAPAPLPLADLPQLLQEGYCGYNIVRFADRYYGFRQGFLPDYSDPDLVGRTGVIVADSPEAVRKAIATRPSTQSQ